eukprot:scaffold1004_cov105-Cylindrotheca_fusiformis.AAC.11
MVTQVEPKEDEKKSADMEHDPHNNHMKGSPASKSTSPIPPSSRPAPIMTNATPNRPPSSASVHSASSGGPSRGSMGATSRRGGRTRCRSPPTMIGRPGSRGPIGDAFPPIDERGNVPPQSPANPSAAAAAAAAAAKSLSNGRTQPPPSSWQYESPAAMGGPVTGGIPRDYGRRPLRDSSRYHGGPPPPLHHPSAPASSRYPPHRTGYPDPRTGGWAPEEDVRTPSRTAMPGRYGPPPSSVPRRDEPYGYRGGPDPSYGYRGGSAAAAVARSRGVDPYLQYNTDEYDRRYPDHPQRHPFDDRMSRRGPPEMPPHYGGDHFRGRERHPRDARDDGYYKGGMPPEGRGAPGGMSLVKRTTRVIGTATPIHVPRASEQAAPSRGSAASVFRGRPGADLGPPRGNSEESGPQKILMALQTPSTSFEEKQTAPKQGSTRTPNENDTSGDGLSPQDPPQIQHSHHQNTTDSNLFFEPTRSPRSPKSQASGPPQPTNSLDMAPSFSLFNQSFDSIGDTAGFFNVGGPLESALQSASFGAGLGASEDKGADLQLSASGGNNSLTQQLLGSSSGALNGTFGMSPSNSFGNGPPAKTGNMMVLRGGQTGPSSPSQVLDMYRSYSASPKKQHPLDENHGPSGPSYGNSFGHGGPMLGRHGRSGHENADGSPNFYSFLKKNKHAFKECSFLLPGLKAALLEAPSGVKEEALDDTPKRHSLTYGEPSPHDTAIASRRVASAVCAFGGTFIGDRASHKSAEAPNQSIFREKTDETPTVTPSSSTSTPPNDHGSKTKSKYDEALSTRYYENDNRLSWEFEENPPIEAAPSKEEVEEPQMKPNTEVEDGSADGDGGEESTGNKAEGEDAEDSNNEDDEDDDDKKDSSQGDQPKMRYRCKLCGQPKQNHTCPYQQSLARSIGVMVYPAVNAFTSTEPGVLAPALSEMNNFIGSAESVSSTENSPNRPTPDRLLRLNGGSVGPSSAQITPESIRTGRGPNSPVSAIATPQRSRTPGSMSRRGPMGPSRYINGGSPGSIKKKRPHAQMSGDEQGDLLFVEAADLKPEQFRMVTQTKVLSKPESFTYPALPLPYAQRKRLSDNLFSLSKEVPQLTDECAAVLREAREKDMWDLAVSELMTQVVIIVHCPDGDARFEGLRRYLLTLGVSC